MIITLFAALFAAVSFAQDYKSTTDVVLHVDGNTGSAEWRPVEMTLTIGESTATFSYNTEAGETVVVAPVRHYGKDVVFDDFTVTMPAGDRLRFRAAMPDDIGLLVFFDGCPGHEESGSFYFFDKSATFAE